MERRSFLGALFGGAAAAPIVAQEALAPSAENVFPWGSFVPGRFDLLEGASAPLLPARMSIGVGAGRGSDTYRTGDPAIDALRSVSGVYKALMERRKAR